MANQHDTENVPVHQPLRYPREDFDAQLRLLEDSLKCVMDFISTNHNSGEENTLQINPIYTNALLEVFLNQVERTKTTFHQLHAEATAALSPTEDNQFCIKKALVDQTLDSITVQVNYLRTIMLNPPAASQAGT